MFLSFHLNKMEGKGSRIFRMIYSGPEKLLSGAVPAKKDVAQGFRGVGEDLGFIEQTRQIAGFPISSEFVARSRDTKRFSRAFFHQLKQSILLQKFLVPDPNVVPGLTNEV